MMGEEVVAAGEATAESATSETVPSSTPGSVRSKMGVPSPVRTSKQNCLDTHREWWKDRGKPYVQNSLSSANERDLNQNHQRPQLFSAQSTSLSYPAKVIEGEELVSFEASTTLTFMSSTESSSNTLVAVGMNSSTTGGVGAVKHKLKLNNKRVGKKVTACLKAQRELRGRR